MIRKHNYIPPDWDPARMFAFACWGDAWLSRRISAVTGGPSHLGLGWRFNPVIRNPQSEIRRTSDLGPLISDAPKPGGGAWIMESLWGVGVQDLKPFANTIDWGKKSPKRRVETIDLKLDARECAEKLKVARTYIGSTSYGEWQLVAMWLHERYDWPVAPSMGRIVCSEFVGRVLYPEMDLRTGGRSFDELTPGSVWAALTGRDPKS